MLVPADLVDLVFTPGKAAANFNLETQTSLCLLTLVRVAQEGGFFTRMIVSNSDPVLPTEKQCGKLPP